MIGMEQPLWPCRGVAEYAYCPRLFYYMTIEGVFVPSNDTVAGARVHKRVDRPSLAKKKLATASEDESPQDNLEADRPHTVRSLALTSDRLGLTGTLDLAEIEGQRAVPIEYRKGRPDRPRGKPRPHDDMMEEPVEECGAKPWPTDRVQVGLQAILLEEAGYEVSEAVIYYAEERLRLRIQVDQALKDEAREVLESARRAAEGLRPPPLVNDSKCPRCSLQPICLPDEINFHRLSANSNGRGAESPLPEEFTPRKLWPPRDDGIHVVFQREGIKVGVRGESVRVTDRDGALVREIPLANMESLALLGGVQVSTQALTVFADHHVPVAFLSAAGRLTAIMDPLGPVSAAVRKAQVLKLEDPGHRLELSRSLVVAKITNQRTLLMRNHGEAPEGALLELAKAGDAATQAETVEELRGHEGNAAAIYFSEFSGMFKSGASPIAEEFHQNGRRRRPPPDPINSVLSFGYSMLTNECVVALRLANLEPTLGAFHTTRPGRPALALDLMEPFRPLIADSVAISAFNRGELGSGHFLRTTAGCAMTDAGRKAFFRSYGRRMDTEVVHPVYDYRLSYRRMLMLHARLIAAWLVGELPSLSFLTTR